MIIRLAIYLITTIVLTYFFYKLGVKYSFESFKDFLSALLTASSMVFTLMGIWIAFLYPNALQRLINPEKIEIADFSESLNETKRLESLVASVLRSAFVVLAIMVIFLTKAVFHETAIYANYVSTIKATALATATTLSAIQVESIAYVIFSNILFINDLHRRREDREADNDI